MNLLTFVKDGIRQGYLTIIKNKVISFIRLVLVAISVAGLLMVLQFEENFNRIIDNEFMQSGAKKVRIIEKTNTEFLGNYLKYDDYTDIQTEISQILSSSPLRKRSSTINTGNIEVRGEIFGVNNQYDKIENTEILHGEFFTNYDVQSAQNVAIVYESFAKKFYGRSNILGFKLIIQNIHGMDIDYNIIGVLKNEHEYIVSDFNEISIEKIYIPITNMNIVDNTKKIDEIQIIVEKNAPNEEVADRTIRYLEYKNGNSRYFYALKDISILKPARNIKTFGNSIFSIISYILIAIAIISFIAISIIYINLKKDEFAIKKMIGATKDIIYIQSVFEYIIISLGGVVIGVIITKVLNIIMLSIKNIQMVLSLEKILLCIGSAIILAMLLSVYTSYIFVKTNSRKMLKGYF